jgi:plasmid stability protein
MKRDKALADNAPLSRIQRTQKAKRSQTHTVGFRLDESYLAKLDTIAAKRGNSIHEQAREMLMALLDGDEAELMAMRLKLEAMTQRFESFTSGMADTIEAILMMNGASEEKARTFVEERLRKRAVH